MNTAIRSMFMILSMDIKGGGQLTQLVAIHTILVIMLGFQHGIFKVK